MSDANRVDLIRDRLIADLQARQRRPGSTYRLQFHADYQFADARDLVPYLHALGITDAYASPYLKARPGSRHGYDILDHRVLNPEIGTPEEYDAWIEALHQHGMGQIYDMVPNHMGIVGNGNPWWNDVLENGPASPYANFFDINWFSYKPALREKVLLPILGDPYGKVLEAQQLKVAYEAGAFSVSYFDHRFPISPCTYGQILSERLPELETALGKETPEFAEYQSILTAISHLPPRTTVDPERIAERQREKEVIKRRIANLVESHCRVREFIDQNVRLLNGQVNDAASFDRLDQLLDAQAYRLSSWRVAADEINYRRFFDVNELAALSMERPEVFEATHSFVLRLLETGKINGLRIDHPDGLYHPRQYLERLQHHYILQCAQRLVEADPQLGPEAWPGLAEALARSLATTDCASPLWRPLPVVVEKILSPGEALPEDWPVYGTTGYEFLNHVNGLFVDSANEPALMRIYTWWAKSRPPYSELVYQNKFLILQVSLSGELHMLGHQLDRLAQAHRWSRDFTMNSLRHALRQIIACFPVYRTYISEDGIPRSARPIILTAVARAKRKNPALSASIFDFVRDLLLLQFVETASPAEWAEQLRFVGKFQQVTAPVMAKGVEDTTFYVYNRLLSLNEVGGSPDHFGISVSAFHAFNAERQARWQHALSATSTHDTKRSEDVRARLNVLSEIPRDWQQRLTRWNAMNERHRVILPELDVAVPDRNEEYFFYQTLIGAWPVEPYSADTFNNFTERIQGYLQKALHEAKVHTSWINPNPAYDDAMRQFVSAVLDANRNGRFLRHFRVFQRRISHLGMLNSLSQLVLKLGAPGVADFYQGTELWDFSLVDPDNRRPVDYEQRRKALEELERRLSAPGASRLELAQGLLKNMSDGSIKLYVTWQGLHCRRKHPELFTTAEYEPLEAVGRLAPHVCAFRRRAGTREAIVVVPRLMGSLLSGLTLFPTGAAFWEDTMLRLPGSGQGTSYRNIFTDEGIQRADATGPALMMGEILAHFPIAILLAQESHHGPA